MPQGLPGRRYEFGALRRTVMNGVSVSRRYPEIDVNPDVLYVDNGRILTSATPRRDWIWAFISFGAISARRSPIMYSLKMASTRRVRRLILHV